MFDATTFIKRALMHSEYSGSSRRDDIISKSIGRFIETRTGTISVELAEKIKKRGFGSDEELNIHIGAPEHHAGTKQEGIIIWAPDPKKSIEIALYDEKRGIIDGIIDPEYKELKTEFFNTDSISRAHDILAAQEEDVFSDAIINMRETLPVLCTKDNGIIPDGEVTYEITPELEGNLCDVLDDAMNDFTRSVESKR